MFVTAHFFSAVVPAVNMRTLTCPIFHFNRIGVCYEVLNKKELSALFTASESFFVVLLSYTQFFIWYKDLFGCYAFSDMIFSIVILPSLISICSFNLLLDNRFPRLSRRPT